MPITDLRLTRLGGRHLAGYLRRRARDLVGYLADRRLVQLVLADAGGLPQDEPLAGCGPAPGGGRGARRGRAAGRTAPALGHVDDQEHDRRHADHGCGQVQDHPHSAGPLRGPHSGARPRAGPGPAARCGEAVVAEPGRGRRLEARLAVARLAVALLAVALLAVGLLAVALLLVTALAVGLLPVGVLGVAVLGVAVLGVTALGVAILAITVLVVAVLRVGVLAESVLPEAAVTEGVLLVVGGFGALLWVRLGLVVLVGPALAAEAARRDAAGPSRRRVTLLAEVLLAEVLLRVARLGRRPVARLVAVACLAGVAWLLTRFRPSRTGRLFVTVTAVRPGAAVVVADDAVRTRPG